MKNYFIANKKIRISLSEQKSVKSVPIKSTFKNINLKKYLKINI